MEAVKIPPLPKSWPHQEKEGSVTVTIYRRTRTTGEKTYDQFRVAYYSAGDRKLESFADWADAYRRARGLLGSIVQGDVKGITLTGSEVLVYERAKKILHPLGVELDAVAVEYAEVRKILGPARLVDAARWYAANCGSLKQVQVHELVAEYLANLKKPTIGRPASDKYLKDVEGRLKPLAAMFKRNVGNLTRDDLQMFFGSLKGGQRTKVNSARIIRSFINYAKRTDRFPKNVEIFDASWFDFENEGEIEIFTPTEISRLLNASRPEMVPVLAIGAFAGLRTAEIERLDWSEVGDKYIEVKKTKSKTKSRRLVPIQPNLAKWLQEHRKPSGAVAPFANLSKQFLWLAEDTYEPAKDGKPEIHAVKWKHNAMRHSFVSYRMAVLQNEHTVSSEAGNSAAMVFQNYRQLVTPEAAATWFSVEPAGGGKVISLPMTAEG